MKKKLFVEKESQKNEMARINEINDLKHKFNLEWTNIRYSPLTYFLLFAFVIAWLYFEEFKQ